MSDPAEGANTSPNSAPDESFRQLYNSHGTAVLNYLIRLTRGDRHRAEDILQETLVRAWRHPEARSVTGEWSRPCGDDATQRAA